MKKFKIFKKYNKNKIIGKSKKRIELGLVLLLTFILAFGQSIFAATVYPEGSKVSFGQHNISVVYGSWEIDSSSKTIISKTYSNLQVSENPDIKNAMLLFDKYENYTLTFDLEVPLGPIGNCYTNIILKNVEDENSELVDWGFFLRFGGSKEGVLSTVLYQLYGSTPIAIGSYRPVPEDGVTGGNKISIRVEFDGKNATIEYKKKNTSEYALLFPGTTIGTTKGGPGYIGISTQNVKIDDWTGDTFPIFRNFNITGTPLVTPGPTNTVAPTQPPATNTPVPTLPAGTTPTPTQVPNTVTPSQSQSSSEDLSSASESDSMSEDSSSESDSESGSGISSDSQSQSGNDSQDSSISDSSESDKTDSEGADDSDGGNIALYIVIGLVLVAAVSTGIILFVKKKR